MRRYSFLMSSSGLSSLQIAGLRAEDAGRYTCQVNTDQELSLSVQLEVTGE